MLHLSDLSVILSTTTLYAFMRLLEVTSDDGESPARLPVVPAGECLPRGPGVGPHPAGPAHADGDTAGPYPLPARGEPGRDGTGRGHLRRPGPGRSLVVLVVLGGADRDQRGPGRREHADRQGAGTARVISARWRLA